MAINIREMTMRDYTGAVSVWQASEGVGLGSSDTEEGLARLLDRNPGFSFVACVGEQIVGMAVCGHDGRRGYLYHVAVNQAYRRKGIGRALVSNCLSALKRDDIHKCHIFVFADNHAGLTFWKQTGWAQRTDLVVLSRYPAADE